MSNERAQIARQTKNEEDTSDDASWIYMKRTRIKRKQ